MGRNPVLLLLLGGLLVGPAPGPAHAQPALEDEVERTLSAILRIEAKVPRDARSAASLGVERAGSGVLVREGYVATIGYLVVEAEAIEVASSAGRTVPAVLAGYDHASGFALLRLLAPITGRPLPIGDAAALDANARALIVSHGGREAATLVEVVSRRPFAGSWEYALDAAIFTSPPVRNWSGAALIGAKGELLGIGSLIVADAGGGDAPVPGNMFVPADLLGAILDDLIARGRSRQPPRPWLGLNAEELRGRLIVARVSPGGPADRAGLRNGDLVLGVAGEEVASLAEFYRKVWARGAAGVAVPLTVVQGTRLREVELRSIEREAYFVRRPGY